MNLSNISIDLDKQNYNLFSIFNDIRLCKCTRTFCQEIHFYDIMIVRRCNCINRIDILKQTIKQIYKKVR